MFQLLIFHCRIFAEGNTYRQNAIACMFPNEYYYHVQLLEVVGLWVLKKSRCYGLGILPNFDDVDSQKINWPAKATPGVFKFSYLRNYCRYFLYICLMKRMKTTLSKNKMRFKVIQKMPAQLVVSTNFLTVPRISFSGKLGFSGYWLLLLKYWNYQETD